MGGEGFAIAVVVVLLLCYLLPALVRRRTVITETVVEERFSENLRILQLKKRVVHQRAESHGFIYHTERKVKPAQRKTKIADELGTELRKLARGRAQLKRRMNTRNTFLQRFQLATIAIVGIAALIWVAVGLTSLSIWFGFGATLLGAAGGALTFSLRKNVALENEKDQQRLQLIETKIAHIKHGVTLGQTKKMQDSLKTRIAAKNKDSKEIKEVSAEFAGAVTTQEETATHLAVAARVEQNPQTSLQNSSPKAQRAHVSGKGSAAKSASDSTSAILSATAISAPSYALRGSVPRRSVKPYVAPEQETAKVPYRPRALGERLGDAALEAANPAPEMTGAEELRQDVLGGGATLDFLLERRRA